MKTIFRKAFILMMLVAGFISFSLVDSALAGCTSGSTGTCIE